MENNSKTKARHRPSFNGFKWNAGNVCIIRFRTAAPLGPGGSLSTEFVHLELLGRHEVMLALVVYGAYVRPKRRITPCLRACVVRLRRVQGCQKSTAP